MKRPSQTQRRGRLRPANSASVEYTEEQTEFLLAMEKYKREKRRMFPSLCEILEVVIALGYRKFDRRGCPPPLGPS